MENNNNRILNEITAWNQKVDNLKGVIGNHVTDYRYLVRAKLDHFKEIKAKYKIPANQDEKMTGKILNAEIRRLEKIAYPNRIERFIRKTIENIRGFITKAQGKTRMEHQSEMRKEFNKKPKQDDKVSQEKDLSKTYSQYNTKLKAVKENSLLPKLRNSNGKGMKM